MSAARRHPITHFLAVVNANPISLVGTGLTTAAAMVFLSLFAISSLGFRGGAYIGIIAFVIVPSVFIAGLALIPLGIWIHRRRRAKRGDVSGDVFPIVDLNKPTTRRVTIVILVATLLNFVILSVAAYEAHPGAASDRPRRARMLASPARRRGPCPIRSHRHAAAPASAIGSGGTARRRSGRSPLLPA